MKLRCLPKLGLRMRALAVRGKRHHLRLIRPQRKYVLPPQHNATYLARMVPCSGVTAGCWYRWLGLHDMSRRPVARTPLVIIGCKFVSKLGEYHDADLASSRKLVNNSPLPKVPHLERMPIAAMDSNDRADVDDYFRYVVLIDLFAVAFYRVCLDVFTAGSRSG